MKPAGFVICILFAYLSLIFPTLSLGEDKISPRALEYNVQIKNSPASTTTESSFFDKIFDSLSTAYNKMTDLFEVTEEDNEPFRILYNGSWLTIPNNYSFSSPMFTHKLPKFNFKNNNNEIQGVRYYWNNRGRLVMKEVPKKKKKEEETNDFFSLDLQGLIDYPKKDGKNNRKEGRIVQDLKNLVNNIVNLQKEH